MGTRSEKPSEHEDMTGQDQRFRTICLPGSLIVEAPVGECVELRVCDGSIVISRMLVQDAPTHEDRATQLP